MKRTPIIGITSSIDGPEQTQFINTAYLHALILAGATPVIISMNMGAEQYEECLDMVDGLVLSGGNDIDPVHYGENPFGELIDVSPKRDTMELFLATEAHKRDMPILAICRGVQLLNVALGGSLYQDLPTQYQSPTSSTNVQHKMDAHEAYATHNVSLVQGTPIQLWYQSQRMLVNSIHHQAIKALAPSLTASAIADDSIIEAVFDTSKHFVLGVQWHPERLDGGSKLFSAFTVACEAYQDRKNQL